jgi:hypothetical protein
MEQWLWNMQLTKLATVFAVRMLCQVEAKLGRIDAATVLCIIGTV